MSWPRALLALTLIYGGMALASLVMVSLLWAAGWRPTTHLEAALTGIPVGVLVGCVAIKLDKPIRRRVGAETA